MPSKGNIQPKVHPFLKLPSFYKMMDRAASRRSCYQLLDRYEQTRKKGDKKVTPNTIDMLFSILRSVPATMEDMRAHQKEVFIKAMEKQEFFCFTTTQSLITMANNTQEYKHIRMCKKTAYNHIELLQKVGIISRKENYDHTGYRNPRPEDKNTNGRKSGRGKIKLYLSPEVIHIYMGKTAKSDSPHPSFFADKEETLQQYILSKESTLLYKNTDTETIVNTPQHVDNKAFAVAKTSSSDIKNTEQESKPLSNKQKNIPPANLAPLPSNSARELERRKKGMLEAAQKQEEKAERNNAARLWDFLCQQLYPDHVFNALARAQSVDILQERLQEAKGTVHQYRLAQMEQYKQNPAYLAAKNRELALKRFQENLPHLERSAFTIVANMIEKERKYSAARGRLDLLWYPPYYLASKAGDYAMGYSKKDWMTLTKKYHGKNKASSAYFKHKNWIMECQYNRIQESHKQGLKVAEKTAQQQYSKWIKQLKEEHYLSQEQKQELEQLFINAMASIFKPVNVL